MRKRALALMLVATTATAQSSRERDYAAHVAQDVIEICQKDAAACAQLERCLAISTGLMPANADAFDPPLGSWEEQEAEFYRACDPFEHLVPSLPMTVATIASDIATIASDIDSLVEPAMTEPAMTRSVGEQRARCFMIANDVPMQHPTEDRAMTADEKAREWAVLCGAFPEFFR